MSGGTTDQLPPNVAYYRACCGAWRCRLDLRITSWARFRAADLGVLDRLRVLSLLLARKLIGPPLLDTTVAFVGQQVVHTTRVSKWGLPLMLGREVITLDSDGRSLVMRGEHRTLPLYFPARTLPESRGTVDAAAERAEYAFVFLGAVMRQTTLREAERVTLTQETDWSEGVQRLERQR